SDAARRQTCGHLCREYHRCDAKGNSGSFMATSISTASHGSIAVEPRPFIGGRFVDGAAEPLEVRNPAIDQQLTDLETADAGQVAQAVAAARAVFDGWSAMKPSARAAILHRAADLIDTHADELARLETLNVGKTIAETRAGDIPRAAHNLRFFADFARDL